MARLSSASQVRDNLEQLGYAHLHPELLDPHRDGCSSEQVAEFVGSWNALPEDPYVAGLPGAGRRRRYGEVSIAAGVVEVLPPAPFVQTEEVNSVFGNIEREFAPLEPGIAESPVLLSLIRNAIACLPQLGQAGPSRVGIHQIRVDAVQGDVGQPTPEGIHQDGHCFVAQVFIDRFTVDGGQSTFYESGAAVYQTYLTESFECLMVDDRRLHHGVSPIWPDGTERGSRDMLLLDFPLAAKEIADSLALQSTGGAG